MLRNGNENFLYKGNIELEQGKNKIKIKLLSLSLSVNLFVVIINFVPSQTFYIWTLVASAD
jgi:hypothetical protein